MHCLVGLLDLKDLLISLSILLLHPGSGVHHPSNLLDLLEYNTLRTLNCILSDIIYYSRTFLYSLLEHSINFILPYIVLIIVFSYLDD